MEPIKITVKLNFREYLRLMYYLTYTRIIPVLLTVLGAIMVCTALYLLFTGSDESYATRSPYSSLLMGSVFIFLTPVSIYFQVKKNFSSNKMLQEKIVFEFTHTDINVRGESFNSVLSWNKLYQVKEIQGWFLIYHNRAIANLIPQHAFSDKQLADFKILVKSIPDLKVVF